MMAAIRAELAEHRWIVRGVLLTGCAALGSALPDLLAIVHRVLS